MEHARTNGPGDGRLWPNDEQELLLQSALAPDDRAVSAFTEWCGRVDIDEALDWASLRLLPLVYSKQLRNHVNAALMGRLKGVYRRAWYETHTLFQRVAPTVAALHDAGVPVLLLKGTPLVLAYYRNHAHRPMSDVDICVSHADAKRAIQVVTSLGWTPTSVSTEDRLRFFHALQFIHPDGGELDLHWHVMVETQDDSLDDLFWAATEALDFLGTPTRMLAPTEQFLHTVLHGMRWNEETPVRWIPDALTILYTRADAIDWDRFVTIAKRLKVCLRIRIAIDYLTRVHDAKVPSHVLSALFSARQTLVERIEASVILHDERRWQGNVWLYHWSILADLARKVDPGLSLLRFLRTYPHYLRFRLDLSGRRELIAFVFRAVGRRVLGRSRRQLA